MKVLFLDQIAKMTYEYTFSLANAIKDLGVNIELAIDLKKETDKCNCKTYNYFNTDEKNIGLVKKGINYIISFHNILKKMKKEDYDIIHTQWFIFSPIDYYYLKKIKRLNKKVVMTVHDILPFNEKFYDRYYHRKLYELSDKIIVQAESNIIRFKELFPQLANKIEMVPLGNCLDYAEDIPKEEALKELELPKDKFIILFFGQIKRVKGVGVLLEAFSQLSLNYENLYLVIAGDTWKDDFSNYQSIIDKYEIQNRLKADIKYIENEDVKYYFTACDVAVLPYLDVYQSGVVQVAYSYKKPVVATKLPAFTPIVKEDETGYLAEVNDIESLKSAILKAYNNKSELNNMGQNGYDLIAKIFAWEDIAKRICYIYDKL